MKTITFSYFPIIYLCLTVNGYYSSADCHWMRVFFTADCAYFHLIFVFLTENFTYARFFLIYSTALHIYTFIFIMLFLYSKSILIFFIIGRWPSVLIWPAAYLDSGRRPDIKKDGLFVRRGIGVRMEHFANSDPDSTYCALKKYSNKVKNLKISLKIKCKRNLQIFA